MDLKTLIFAPLLLILPNAGSSHEFWLEPDRYQAPSGENVGIRFRNGEDFKGIELSWFDRRIGSVSYVLDGKFREYRGLPGDLPGMTLTVSDELTAVAYSSTMSKLTYDSWDKVQSFVTHKDAPWFNDTHAARGLPQEGVTEGYWRFAKTLIGGEPGNGTDRDFGMETEFVMQSNPFADGIDSVQLILLYQGQPRPDAQVEMWEKSGDAITHSFYRTDNQGLVTLPVRAGASYQIDAVVIREPESDQAIEAGVMWESLWANMTFGLPQ